MLKLASKISYRRSIGGSARAFAVIVVATVAALAFNGPAQASDQVARDTFDLDAPGTPLPSHTVDLDSVGGGWTQSIGADFRITADGLAVSEAGQNGDLAIAVIDTLLPEYDAEVDFTRADGSSVIGGVFRFVDQDNYFATYHDGETLKLVKVTGGVETVLDQVEISTDDVISRSGEVSVRESLVTVRAGSSAQLETTDSELHGATKAGLLYQSVQTTKFTDFEVNGLSEAPGEKPEQEPLPAIVFDSFTAADGVGLPAHNTTEMRPGGQWQEVRGTWTIVDGKVTLASPAPSAPFSDQVAAIPSGDVDDSDISADVTWNGGTAGIAWDVTDASNYSIVFWDGFYLVAGRVDDGVFRERGRQSVEWAQGQTRELRARINDGNTRVYLDSDVPVMLAVGLGGEASGGAGFFVRGSADNAFDNFTARPSSPLDQPDPTLPLEPADASGGASQPSDAWVFDSFNALDGMLLQHREPELDPSGLGWQVISGNWQVRDAQASEQTGVYGASPLDRFAVIDSGRDEYEIDAEVYWDGGRAGVLFGGSATGPEDAGKNGFLFFRNGDSLEVGKLIGGVYFPLDETDAFGWPAGESRTMRIVVEGETAGLWLDESLMMEITDADLAYSTWTGIFQRGRNDGRFDDFTVTVPNGVEPPPIALTVTDVPDATVIPGTATTLPVNVTGPGAADAEVSATALPQVDPPVVIHDSFNGPDPDETLNRDIPLSETEPETAPPGAGWSLAHGSLEKPFIDFDELNLPGAAHGGDQRMVIDTRYSDVEVRSNAIGGDGRFGLVARHDGSTDDGNWAMGWMDFDTQSLLIGASINDEFRLLAMTPYAWGEGQRREMTLTAVGESLALSINGQEILTATAPGLGDGTYAGLFARGGAYAKFDDFTVTALGLPSFMSLEPGPGIGTELVVAPRIGDHGEYEVTLTASTEEETATSTFNLTIPEPVDPQADAGGPYATTEGQPVMLDATGSISGGPEITEYLWDLDGDGVTDLSGASPQLTPSYPGISNVTLTVVDTLGLSAQATTELTVAIGQPQVDLGDLFLLGDASATGGLLSLTSNSQWSGGAAWMKQPQPVADGFTATFDFTLTDLSGGEPGADGIAFVIQVSPVGIEAIGLPGAGLGYELIENSLAIEIDNWANPESGERAPHIAVHSAGPGPNSPGEAARIDTAELDTLEMDVTHTARVVYEAGTLRVYLDDLSTPALEVAVDLSTLLDLPEDGTAFVGFTAGTGGAIEGHEVSSFHFATGS